MNNAGIYKNTKAKMISYPFLTIEKNVVQRNKKKIAEKIIFIELILITIKQTSFFEDQNSWSLFCTNKRCFLKNCSSLIQTLDKPGMMESILQRPRLNRQQINYLIFFSTMYVNNN